MNKGRHLNALGKDTELVYELNWAPNSVKSEPVPGVFDGGLGWAHPFGIRCPYGMHQRTDPSEECFSLKHFTEFINLLLEANDRETPLLGDEELDEFLCRLRSIAENFVQDKDLNVSTAKLFKKGQLVPSPNLDYDAVGMRFSNCLQVVKQLPLSYELEVGGPMPVPTMAAALCKRESQNMVMLGTLGRYKFLVERETAEKVVKFLAKKKIILKLSESGYMTAKSRSTAVAVQYFWEMDFLEFRTCALVSSGNKHPVQVKGKVGTGTSFPDPEHVRLLLELYELDSLLIIRLDVGRNFEVMESVEPSNGDECQAFKIHSNEESHEDREACVISFKYLGDNGRSEVDGEASHITQFPFFPNAHGFDKLLTELNRRIPDHLQSDEELLEIVQHDKRNNLHHEVDCSEAVKAVNECGGSLYFSGYVFNPTSIDPDGTIQPGLTELKKTLNPFPQDQARTQHAVEALGVVGCAFESAKLYSENIHHTKGFLSDHGLRNAGNVSDNLHASYTSKSQYESRLKLMDQFKTDDPSWFTGGRAEVTILSLPKTEDEGSGRVPLSDLFGMCGLIIDQVLDANDIQLATKTKASDFTDYIAAEAKLIQLLNPERDTTKCTLLTQFIQSCLGYSHPKQFDRARVRVSGVHIWFILGDWRCSRGYLASGRCLSQVPSLG